MKKRRRKKLHPTGQLSIFAILMFQMLFILFAMSLNVALVVHDKINLQNSVDLAAYYGAMKQAEMMNAIAHINYQIRQSWKLFVWRYRVLGNIGVAQNNLHPGFYRDIGRARRLLPVAGPFPSLRPPRPGPYFFCVGHRWWGGLYESTVDTQNDNACVGMAHTIPRISTPRAVRGLGGLGAIFNGMRTVSGRINGLVGEKCTVYGYNSWLLGTYSVIHFLRDQSIRKYMIKKLAETIGDGNDLDGGSILTGVQNTLKKNLNFINRRNIVLPPKRVNSIENVPVGTWLQDRYHKVNTQVLYAKTEGPIGGGCEKEIDFLHNPIDFIASNPHVQQLITEMLSGGAQWPISCTKDQCDPSAGIHKDNRWIVFFAVEAEVAYKNQIFLPGGRDLKLKAQAFAKPFGGRIGPPEDADGILNDPGSWRSLPLPNYSRYPGDTSGLRSIYTQRPWSFIRNSPKVHKNVENYMIQSGDLLDPLMGTEFGGGSRGRAWEMKAIAPDLFDITYFTILPYYQHTYFKKVKRLVGAKARGDLGYVESNSFFEKNSILSQVNRAPSISGNVHNFSPFYKIKNTLDGSYAPTSLDDKPALLLTGWNPPLQKYLSHEGNYRSDLQTNFGKCNKWANSDISRPKGKIANGCVYGGRSGYSVKMISHAFIQSIRNRKNPPLPSNWAE